MRYECLWAVVCLLAGCEGGMGRGGDAGLSPDAGLGGPDGGGLVVRPDDGPPRRPAACPGDRQIALVVGRACPIDRRAPWFTSQILQIGDARFCAYTWTDGGANPDPDLLPLRGAQPDCHVVAAQASPEDVRASLAPAFHAAFLQAADAMTELPPASGALGGTVTVAVIDTWADEEAPGATNPVRTFHGQAMAHFIGGLTGARSGAGLGADNGLRLDARRALDLFVPEDGERPVVVGEGDGHFGYQGRLAEEIARAVAEAPAGPRQRLVINLAVGWNPHWGGLDEGMPLSSAVVLAALVQARCAGAAIFAAAGNSSGGQAGTTGPILPAAWEQWTVDAAIEALGIEDVACPLSADERRTSLVFAVGGLDYDDQPLANARPQGLPRLGATAFYASADVSGRLFAGPAPVATDFFTGSSVSTAVASAAAALSWRYRPALSASALHTLVLRAAMPVGPRADFCLRPPCGEVRRVSVCRAVESAVERSLPCRDLGNGRAVPPPLTANLGANVRPPDRRTESSWAAARRVCDVRWLRAGVGQTVGQPCPDLRHYDGHMVPWAVSPQPQINGCDVCSLQRASSGGWTLFVGVSAKVSSLDGPMLVLPGGQTIDIGKTYRTSSLTGGKFYQFNGLPISSAPSSASLVYRVSASTGTWSAKAPLYIKF